MSDRNVAVRGRQCTVCATPLRVGVRTDCRFCGVRCRVRAHRLRYSGRRASGSEERSRSRGARNGKVVPLSSQAASDAATARIDAELNNLREQITQMAAESTQSIQEQETLNGQLAELQSENAQLRKSLDHEQQAAAKTTAHISAVLKELDRYRGLYQEAQSEQARCAKELRAARAAVETLKAGPSQPAARPLPMNAAAHAAEVQALRQRIVEFEKQTAWARERWTLQEQDITRLGQANAVLNESLANAQTRCAQLALDNEALRKSLAGYESGLTQALHAGTMGAVLGLVTAFAESRGLKVPPLHIPGVTPAPAHPTNSRPQAAKPAPKPTPPPDDPETKRWRKIIAEQQRRGWEPDHDQLVGAKRDEICAEDGLAKEQASAGLPVTARRLEPGVDVDFLAMRAALEARKQHFAKNSKLPNRFARASWVSESYLLDLSSEFHLLHVSQTRRSDLQSRASRVRFGGR